MNYPLISEYVQSIRFSEENFDKLSNLRPILDEDGNPVMSSGNFAVVFKMKDKETGKLHAVKCFLREQEGRAESYKLIASELEYVSSTFLTPIQYLEKELFVDTTQEADTEFPVLLMDWVEGITLDKYIRTNINDSYKLSLIAYQFCRMGSWLLSQEFAHGDLKPDNIIVREDGQLVLVDYDGMFVPAMRGQKSRELGSVDYRHPLRTEDVFNGSIDDFSIASIALSLKAISLNPELLYDFGADDRLLFSAKNYQNIGECECMKAIQSLSTDTELAQILGLFYIAYAKNELSKVSFRLLNIAKPEHVPEVALSTAVTDEDEKNGIKDEYGVLYSRDGFRLLKAPRNIVTYKIKDGTKVICEYAFYFCKALQKLVIPSSVTSIAKSAFWVCGSLRELVIPSSVTSIGEFAFWGCSSLRELVIPSSVTSIGESAFSGCKSLQELVIPPSVISIEESAFKYCNSLRELVIPSSVTSVGESAFFGCDSLRELVIPSSVTNIGEYAFSGCKSLQELVIPSSVTNIGKNAFGLCSSLRELVIPSSVTSIGEDAFWGCSSLRELAIPSSVTSIAKAAFSGCKSLQELVIPPSVTSIGEDAFKYCSSLRELVIPSSVTSIGRFAFSGCYSLRELVIQSSAISIGDAAFWGNSLSSIIVPKGQAKKYRVIFGSESCDPTKVKEIDS